MFVNRLNNIFIVVAKYYFCFLYWLFFLLLYITWLATLMLFGRFVARYEVKGIGCLTGVLHFCFEACFEFIIIIGA